MKKLLLTVSLFAAALSIKAQCTELFISKYIQFGGNNKAIEIYNPTPNPITLNGYVIERWKAASSGFISTSMNDSLHLNGVIPAYGTWVVTNGQTTDIPLTPSGVSPKCDPALQAMANQFDNLYGTYGSSTGAPMYFKGNDQLVLRKPDQSLADVFGENGVTVKYWSTLPTYRGAAGEGKWITKGYMMERRPTVTGGVTAYPTSFNPLAEYDTIPTSAYAVRQDTLDTYSLFGSHACICSTMGIKSNANVSKATIFPNPTTTGILNVVSSEIINEVKVYSVMGQLVYADAKISKNEYVLSTEKMNKGTYVIWVTYKTGLTERKNFTIE